MFDLPTERRIPIWIIAGIAALALWLVFGQTSAPTPVISAWGGDGAMVQNAAGAVAAPQGLTALFSRQNVGTASDLATDPHPQDQPFGNPTGTERVVLTQGYDVGSHAPAAVWGGLDLAIDGNGDGAADPQGSMGAPLYATMSGVIELQPDSYPAGNHLWIKNGSFKVGYGHLKEFAVQNGQTVKRGDLIAYMGSTGQSSGPHLHYHIWKDGVNVNPVGFGALPEN